MRALRRTIALAALAAAPATACADAAGDAEQRAPDAAAPPDAAPPAAAAPPADAAAAPPEPPPVEAPLPEEDLYPRTLAEQREALYRRMEASLGLAAGQLAAVRAIFEQSPVLGQGKPDISRYAMTRRQCREARAAAGVVERASPVCGGPFMSPLYDPAAGQKEEDARACIDRYEFPGIPCEHPVVWPTARQAIELCAAIGKRLCDAHEWEGACAGAVRAPDVEYQFGKPRKDSRDHHNEDREIVWAYGKTKDHARCATNGDKTKGCTSGGWKHCGTNAYPAGAFPGCVSPLGVYDQHGNVAEHMNLPTRPEELTSAGGAGYTEMKGSWFIFNGYEAHPDDCRWRAPDWHASKAMDRRSHQNYHLGFRCCKTVK